MRLVTPAESEYSSQACAYLRLVPRSSRKLTERDLTPLPTDGLYALQDLLGGLARSVEADPPRSTASPRFTRSRSAGVGSVAGGKGPAARNPSSSPTCLALQLRRHRARARQADARLGHADLLDLQLREQGVSEPGRESRGGAGFGDGELGALRALGGPALQGLKQAVARGGDRFEEDVEHLPDCLYLSASFDRARDLVGRDGEN